MINLIDIENRIRRIGLDAEGSDRYLRDIDIIPAINASVEWLVGILAPLMGKDKAIEERLSDLQMTRIWQTSSLSRFNIEEDLIGFSIWTITRVCPKPQVYMAVFKRSWLPAPYQMQVAPSLGMSQLNKPLVRNHFSTGDTLKSHMSTYRPELSFVRGDHFAARIPLEQQSGKNPFEAGFKHVDDFTTYGYMAFNDYSNTLPDGTYSGGYQLSTTKEIEIIPGGKMLVAVSFIRVPEVIPLTATDDYEIPFPASMMELISMKALNYISVKQGDQTTIFNVSIQDVIQHLR